LSLHAEVGSFRFWDVKVNTSYLLFQISYLLSQTKNEIFFPAIFLSHLPFLLKAGSLTLLPFNQLFI
ncbi:MAG: hypothetical protein ABSF81_01295, partial [Bacteroidales bacterium]